jgi:hypothetical protein
MVGHLGMLLHPDPRRVMVIGLGSGATAGAALRHPGVTADVAEISADVVRAAAFFEGVNDGVLRNPRMALAVADAREFLLLTNKRYDVIVSEPTNVWIPGVASLFTHDFYAVVLDRLEPGGLFVQWIQLYSCQPRIVASVMSSLRTVFPHVSVWLAEEGDLVLLAGRERPPFDPEAFARRLREIRPAAGIAANNPRVELLSDPVLFLLGQIASDEGARLFWAERAAPPYRDAFPRMEFQAARSQFVGRSYGIASELDERLAPLGSEPLFLAEYLRRSPLTPADRAGLSEQLARLLPASRLRRALLVLQALEDGEDPTRDLSLPEGSMANLLLTRFLDSRWRGGLDPTSCSAYLKAMGSLLAEATSVLGSPSTRKLTARAEECAARNPDLADRLLLDLVPQLAAAGAVEDALARLQALDAQGRLERASPHEKADLLSLGRRLSLRLGRRDEAQGWHTRARLLRSGLSVPPGAARPAP